MRYPKFVAARSHLKPLAALLLATALGGCLGYAGYPSRDYGYGNPNYGYSSYPSSYYAGYPQTYSTSYSYRPYYSPEYGRYGNANQNSGVGN
jgi:hypothetical protein